MPDLQFKINLCCKVRNVGILGVCFAHYLESLHIFVLELNFSNDLAPGIWFVTSWEQGESLAYSPAL